MPGSRSLLALTFFLELALERRAAGETVAVTVKREGLDVDLAVELGEGRR